MDERGRARERAETWREERARARAFGQDANLARMQAAVAQRRDALRRWLSAELAPGRLVPWLPVAFGCGIALYFAAPQEPFWWAGLVLALALAAATVALRESALGFPVLAVLTAVAAGFALATLRAQAVSHPVLETPVFSARLSGFVEAREQRERSDRIVLRVDRFEAGRAGARPERVRIAVRKGTAPAVGSFVELRARLNPPLAPLRPGGYDFARDLYFQRIGASGFALGAIRQAAPPQPPDFRLRYTAAIGGLRDDIDARIRAALAGDRAAIASALITGKRDAISAPVNEAMYVSSLGHVLSISGYHMAVVAGAVFFAIRAVLALFPVLASRHPIKKWAAAGALGMAAFYLLLSGAEVATQRAFIMTAIVLAGVMCDRPALTLRTIAVAALGVLLLAPEALVHPSFQMSFAATLALIAAYERGLPWLSAVPETPRAARIALWGGRQVIGLLVASLVAGLATTLFAAYHFHRLAPYGILSNLLAMPVVSAWVMPWGLASLVAMPFGFDAACWHLMGVGIEWMTAVAQWVAGLPGAVGRVTAFGVGPLLVASFGLILVCLLRSPLRWSGAVMIVLACIAAARTPPPDVLIAQDARMVAVRNAEGRLSVMKSRRDDFTLRAWLAADADGRDPRDISLAAQVRCDDLGCTAPLRGGGLVALAQRAEALIDDCARALVVVTQPTASPDCKALAVDRGTWRRYGAAALTRTAEGFTVTFARPLGTERPWARSPVMGSSIAESAATRSSTDGLPAAGSSVAPHVEPRRPPGRRAPARDATPDPEHLEAGD
jgi:competence protein ComEC